MAQLVKHPTLDFNSGHDLRVVRSSPRSGSTLRNLVDILSLSLKINKSKKKLRTVFKPQHDHYPHTLANETVGVWRGGCF